MDIRKLPGLQSGVPGAIISVSASSAGDGCVKPPGSRRTAKGVALRMPITPRRHGQSRVLDHFSRVAARTVPVNKARDTIGCESWGKSDHSVSWRWEVRSWLSVSHRPTAGVGVFPARSLSSTAPNSALQTNHTHCSSHMMHDTTQCAT